MPQIFARISCVLRAPATFSSSIHTSEMLPVMLFNFGTVAECKWALASPGAAVVHRWLEVNLYMGKAAPPMQRHAMCRDLALTHGLNSFVKSRYYTGMPPRGCRIRPNRSTNTGTAGRI